MEDVLILVSPVVLSLQVIQRPSRRISTAQALAKELATCVANAGL